MREINLEFFAKIIFGTCHMRLNPVHQMNFSSFCSSEVFLYFIGLPIYQFNVWLGFYFRWWENSVIDMKFSKTIWLNLQGINNDGKWYQNDLSTIEFWNRKSTFKVLRGQKRRWEVPGNMPWRERHKFHWFWTI